MNKYIAFYNNKQITVEADTSLQAQGKAATELKVKDAKRYMITVMLTERADGSEVTHSTASIG